MKTAAFSRMMAVFDSSSTSVEAVSDTCWADIFTDLWYPAPLLSVRRQRRLLANQALTLKYDYTIVWIPDNEPDNQHSENSSKRGDNPALCKGK